MASVRRRFALALVLALVAVPSVTAASGAGPAYTVRVLRGLGGEPGITVSPDGQTVLVVGAGAAPAVFYRSTDAGRSYSRLTPRFSNRGGADFDITFLDNRTVVATDLSVTGNGVVVHRSEDRGSTWTTTTINNDLYDRPWVDHFGQTVYVATRGFDQVPYLYTSTDGGRSFGAPGVVIGTDPGGLGPADGVVVVLQHLAVAPTTGDVYVLKQHTGGLYVSRLVPGPVPRFVSYRVAPAQTENGFSWMTVDSAGTVYVLAHEVRDGVPGSWLYYSSDRGATWSAGADLANSAEDGIAAFGAVDGGKAGRLSVVQLRGDLATSSAAQDWYAEVGAVHRADTATPRISLARPVAKPVHQEGICSLGLLCPPGQNRNLLDYVSTDVAQDGTVYAVVGSDGPATGDDASTGSAGVTGVVLRSTRRVAR